MLIGCGSKQYENIPDDPIDHQAKADAELDAKHDLNLLAYFGAGMSAPFAAAMCGITSLCLYDVYIGYEGDYFPCTGAAIGAGGVLSMLIGHYIRPPNPPPERLIGKSADYVKFYAEVYRSEMQLYRMRSVAAGAACGSGILTTVGIVFYFFSSGDTE